MVTAVLPQFIGEIQQQPPIYSAIKINGKRAYKMARAGEVFEMPMRTVTVFSLELVGFSYPDITIRVHVSSGTYIRTLAQDIGLALGTGAYCVELRRTKIAAYSIADAEQAADYETY